MGTISKNRRRLFALSALALAPLVRAQDRYPSHPIHLITAYPPGGTTDILARLLAPRIAAALGGSIVVENKGGGNTVIGTDYVSRALPDGYTLLLASNSHVVVPHLVKTPFDPIRNFSAIATISRAEQLMVLNPGVPAKNLQEFVAYAKANPGKLNYASSGNGNVAQLAGEKFNLATGAQVHQINYKGTGPAIVDVLSGQVQLTFAPAIAVLQYVKAGQMRALGVSGKKRLATLPDVPTFTEAGHPELDVPAWYGFLAPAGLPPEIRDQLASAINTVLQQPDVRATLEEQGNQVFVSTPDQFSRLMRTDLEEYGRVVREAGITAQ